MKKDLCHTFKSICDLSGKFWGNIQIVQEIGGKTGEKNLHRLPANQHLK